jgi:type IX secretion system substrate protein
MRLIITYFFVAMALTNLVIAQESIEHFETEFVSNPQDDKHLVLTSRHQSLIFDFEDNSYRLLNIETDKYSEIENIFINAISNRIAYQTDSSLIIYNYNTLNKIQELEFLNNNTSKQFSKNGDSLLVYEPIDETILIYEVTTGAPINSIKLEPTANGYSFISINPFNDEIVFRKNDSILFWSISEQKGKNTLPIYSNTDIINFTNNGKQFYYYDSETKVLSVARTENGELIFSKKLSSSNFFYLKDVNFDSDMNFIIIYDTYNSHSIYDIANDSLLKTSYSNVFYISPDMTNVIGSELTGYQCGWYAFDLVVREQLYIYNLAKKTKVKPIPNTFVESPYSVVISDNNQFAVISSRSNDDSTLNVLVTLEEDFIKYLELRETPVLFIDKAKYLAYMDGQTMKFYDFEANQVVKEFATELQDITNYYYTEKGGGRIILVNKDSIRIFHYPELSLNNSISKKNLGMGERIKFDGNENLLSYNNHKIVKYNIFNYVVLIDTVKKVQDKFDFRDFTPEGRYILYSNDNYKVGVYDLRLEEFTTKDLKSKLLNDNSNSFNAAFIGNIPLIWYEYRSNVIEPDLLMHTYDFDYDKDTYYYRVKFDFVVSNNFKSYVAYGCPNFYRVIQIRDPQSSVETTTAITGSVYPNPASDFIKIDMNVSSMNSSIEIFDAYGKQVKSVIYTGEEIDISSLTAGVYFVKTQSQSYKFIKM